MSSANSQSNKGGQTCYGCQPDKHGWAIDNIPSLTDAMPYASYELGEWAPDVCLAGFGPLSDGIPVAIGGGGKSERDLPPPPRTSKPLYDADPTARMRKP